MDGSTLLYSVDLTRSCLWRLLRHDSAVLAYDHAQEVLIQIKIAEIELSRKDLEAC
jgi:hypothetical protein